MNWLAITSTAAAFLCIAILFAFGLGLPGGLAERIQAAWAWLSGLSLTAVLFAFAVWQVAPNPAKGFVARLIRLAPDVPAYLKRTAIKNELESSVNRAFEQFASEGFTRDQIVLSWVKPGEMGRAAFFQGGKAFLKLDYSESPHINLVEAAMLFCRRGGLLPETRQYIPHPLMRAIDLQFIDEILQRQRAAESRGHFIQEVQYPELQNSPETAKFVGQIQAVRQYGLFTRVLLPELRDYALLAHDEWTQHRHKEEIESFMNFLEATVRSREKGTKTALLHVGQAIRTAIVLVGIPSRLQFEGTRPYVRRTAIHEQAGAQTVYLLGYNHGIHYVELIARETIARGVGASYTIDVYDASAGGQVVRHRIARLVMEPGAGTRFIAEHPSTDEWPDIEDDVEWRRILHEVTQVTQGEEQAPGAPEEIDRDNPRPD